ncbi:hypothetical protein SVIOM342S_00110 [Streptomyces violaceorubidus]
MALVRPLLGAWRPLGPRGGRGGQDLLVGVQAVVRVPGERDPGLSVPGEGAGVDAGVAGARADEFVQGQPVRAGQRQQVPQPRLALPRLQPGQGAHGDAGDGGELGQCEPAACRMARRRAPSEVIACCMFVVVAAHGTAVPVRPPGGPRRGAGEPAGRACSRSRGKTRRHADCVQRGNGQERRTGAGGPRCPSGALMRRAAAGLVAACARCWHGWPGGSTAAGWCCWSAVATLAARPVRGRRGWPGGARA